MTEDDPKPKSPAGADGAGQPQTPGVVARFWEWVKKRNEQERQQDQGIPGAIARGVTGAATQTVRTIAEGAAFVDRKTGLGEAIEPGFNEAYDRAGGARGLVGEVFEPVEAARDEFLGKRSDDTVTQMIEDITQFTTGYMTLGGLKVLRGGAALAERGYLAGSLARGAVVDAVAFEPYEAQFAEFAARTNIPGLEQLGELLSVNGDDSAIVARLKRSAAGAVLGVTFDGLIATGRALNARRTLARGNLSGAEKAAAEAKLAESEATLEAIEQGTSRPNDPIVVRSNPDDTATLVVDGVEGPKFSSHAEARAQAHSMNSALNSASSSGQYSSAVEGMFERAGSDPEKMAAEIRTRLQGAVDATAEVSDEAMDQIADDMMGRMNLDEATNILTSLSNDATIQSAVNKMAQAHSRNLGRRIAALDILLESRAHDPAVKEEAIRRVQELLNFEDNRKWIVGEQGRALRLEGTKNGKPMPKEGPGTRAPSETVEPPTGTRPKSKATGPEVAGMATRDASQNAVNEANIRQITRLFRLAGGSPKDVTAAIQATNIIQKTGKADAILEVFVNSILSNPATAKTILLSGRIVESFEALGRVGAGVATGNKALSQEGVDIMYGLWSHLSDNLRIARRALNEGQSVINPAPAHHAIGGTTGQLIRAPGAVLMAGDEFTRVANYRAYVRAKSLRTGRQMGLSGEKLAAHLEGDLRAAFDPETGIATIPEALQYAERSTLSGPLGSETTGGRIGEFIRNTPGLQFLAPFQKAGTNIFRFTTQHTPFLSRLNDEAKAIMEAGGEEAAVLQTKQAMAAAVYTMGGLLAVSGNLTGDVPGDPAVRELWLKNHQPYSVRIDGKWYSYRRTDPIGIMLGLSADIAQFSQQMDENDPQIEQLALAMMSAGATSILTPTYMKGVGDFLDAFGDGDPAAIQRWSRGFASSFVPAGANALNTDPYFREVRSISDAIKNRLPGFSQTLDPKFDLFGEPVLNGGVGNRSALFRTKDASVAVEEELLALGRGFQPFPQKGPGNVDLTDRNTFDNGTGVSPYRRMMELVAQPVNGKTLRERVEELVKSERYQNASPGTGDYPGGRRWDLVARERTRAYNRAFRQVQREYPKLREEIRRAERLSRAAYRGGEEGLTRAEELFGALEQARPLRNSRIQQR